MNSNNDIQYCNFLELEVSPLEVEKILWGTTSVEHRGTFQLQNNNNNTAINH